MLASHMLLLPLLWWHEPARPSHSDVIIHSHNHAYQCSIATALQASTCYTLISLHRHCASLTPTMRIMHKGV